MNFTKLLTSFKEKRQGGVKPNIQPRQPQSLHTPNKRGRSQK